MSNAVEVNDSDFEMQIEQHKGLADLDQIQRALDSRNSILQGWEARRSGDRIRRQAGAGGEVQAARCGVISRVGGQTTRERRKGGDGRHGRYSVPG